MEPGPFSPETLDAVASLLRPLYRYHRFTLRGAEHIPREGPCILVVHHSLATYDGFLIGDALRRETGRVMRGLGDDRLFQIPGLRALMYGVGIVPASPEAGERLLREGYVVGLAPGGMWESLRPHTEKRRSRWGDRRGFARLALRTGSPMVFAAAPAADEIFKVYPSRITDRIYELAHLPVPLARGVGPTLLPRRVTLTAWLSEPLFPPPLEPDRLEEQAEALRRAAEARMAELLLRA